MAIPLPPPTSGPGLNLGSLGPQGGPPPPGGGMGPPPGPGGPPVDPRILQAAMLLAQYIKSQSMAGGPPPPGGQFGNQPPPTPGPGSMGPAPGGAQM